MFKPFDMFCDDQHAAIILKQQNLQVQRMKTTFWGIFCCLLITLNCLKNQSESCAVEQLLQDKAQELEKYKTEVKKMISDKDSIISQLTKDNSDLNTKNTNLINQIGSKDIQIQKLIEQIKRLNILNAQLNQKLKDNQSCVNCPCQQDCTKCPKKDCPECPKKDCPQCPRIDCPECPKKDCEQCPKLDCSKCSCIQECSCSDLQKIKKQAGQKLQKCQLEKKQFEASQIKKWNQFLSGSIQNYSKKVAEIKSTTQQAVDLPLKPEVQETLQLLENFASKNQTSLDQYQIQLQTYLGTLLQKSQSSLIIRRDDRKLIRQLRDRLQYASKEWKRCEDYVKQHQKQ